ncbi:MAG: hypothetical protein U0744_05305 [Gemmataceae bacterium]
MKSARFLLAAFFSLVGVVAISSSEAEAAKKKSANKNHAIHGVIESVSHKGKETILHVKTNGKKGAEHTVFVDPNTPVEKHAGKKKGVTPATVANLQRGEHVVVHMQGRKATKVDIVAKGKKKAKKNK